MDAPLPFRRLADASEAPHLCVETSLREDVGGSASSALLWVDTYKREVIARSPGCLTGESEERETWTAESLRTASSNGKGFGFFLEEDGHGRDFGGQRLRYIAERSFCGASRRAVDQWVDLVKTCDLPESISSNLRV